MADKKLEDQYIKKPPPHKLEKSDLNNAKVWPVEKILKEVYFNKYETIDGIDTVVPTTEKEREEIHNAVKERIKKQFSNKNNVVGNGNEVLMNRYLEAIGNQSFILEERYLANKDVYDYHCSGIKDSHVTSDDGRQGYAVTKYQSAVCHYEILFTERGIQDIDLGKETILIEGSAVLFTYEKFIGDIQAAHDKETRAGLTLQAYKKELREAMQGHMVMHSVSSERAKLLTRQLLNILI